MFKVNEYFEGSVKSIAFQNKEGNFTIGAMAPGDYEFGTATVEIMTVISGKLQIQMPAEQNWKIFNAGDSFTVEKDKKFKVKVDEPSAYLCQYK
jgi:purine/pyrimidine-nucleoside phosphorylase